MPRGKSSANGDTNVAANGYHYTKQNGSWRLTHHIIAEENLGRPLSPDERAYFIDKDRTNLTPSNIGVARKRKGRRQRIEALKARIQLLQEELAELEGRSKEV